MNQIKYFTKNNGEKTDTFQLWHSYPYQLIHQSKFEEGKKLLMVRYLLR